MKGERIAGNRWEGVIGQERGGGVRGRGPCGHHVPASSSLRRAGASRGVSGGVSTPLSCSFVPSLLGGVDSVVVTGGAAGAGTGAPAPKK